MNQQTNQVIGLLLDYIYSPKQVNLMEGDGDHNNIAYIPNFCIGYVDPFLHSTLLSVISSVK